MMCASGNIYFRRICVMKKDRDNIMRKRMRKTGRTLILLLCMMMCASCASGREGQGTQDEQGIQAEEPNARDEQAVPEFSAEAENGAGNRMPGEAGGEEEAGADEEPITQKTEFSPERQMQENEEQFLEKAKAQKAETEPAEKLFRRLLSDGIFQNGEMALTGLVIDDIDGNGQMDMLVMVQDAAERPFYGSGGLWIYMNEDEPYCFEEEACSFYGWFDAFWEDVDNDENVEIVFSAEGTGCGAAGDFYKAVFKYKNHTIERMELPSDLEEDYDQGLRIELVQEPVENVYSAYCPYLDDLISFYGKNAESRELPENPQVVGGNARGFYHLQAVEYEGKMALQASEYLYGEGGTVHNVATAQFLITWEKDGTPKVLKWWISDDF